MFRRAPWALVGLLLLGATGRAKETDEAWIRGIFTGKSPRAVALVETEAWQRASTMAARAPQAFVLVGSGRSMQPLYAPGTILVLQLFPFELLERGQTVLYRNHARKIVAHVLIARARDGWRAAGLNNAQHDMEAVSPENLVGVVIGAFRPLPAPRVQLAAIARP
jgi:hypothetical protein